MEFISKDLEQYVEQHSTPESDLLKRLDRETHAKILMPRMVSGHIQGRFLSMISHMIKPQIVLEIGTFTGYSAICLAEGLPPEGKLITIDVNEEIESFARSFIEKSDKGKQIEQKIGNALDIIPELDMQFDLVFIDADKINYQKYYDLVFDKVKQGGYILADNVLWSGKVFKDIPRMDKDTKALMDFNDMVQNDERVENVMLPVRDGLLLIRKK
ncbi:O-methyltransferase family 3 [Sporocytophaga myxococcoides]|uniref:O-methyltransferase family 3 n=1 Tax=Sporocytophaga myxococcoides TaxID=153721 RepID=A0A098L9R1_9BACT|nr:O-methyltransferase [Sporocytophaga myxococcoides]GAL82878.1 O-methyltransferase family 3 [Sporocytophaga myxococcoides]